MRHIFTFCLLLGSATLSWAQHIIETAPTTNPVLQQWARTHQPPTMATRLPTACTYQRTLYVPQGSTVSECLAAPATGALVTTNDECQPVTLGSLSLTDNCFTYTANANAQGNDRLCLTICAADTICCTYNFEIQVKKARTLPFMDDFSYSHTPYPDTAFWLDNDVFVNNTLGINPPSVGMATFDGLDANGSPYSGGYEASDRLTSTFIDLSPFTINNKLHFNFYAQPKGWGDKPEYKDSLVVEFRDIYGNWKRVATLAGMPDSLLTYNRFDFYNIPLDNSDFIHDKFQFRFKNYGSRNGAVDLWHLDYVKLTANLDIDTTFADIAFTQVPPTILRRYTAMPWVHCITNLVAELDSVHVAAFYNHFATTNDVQTPQVTLTETTTNTPIYNYVLLDGTQFNIPPREHITFTNPIPTGIYSNYINTMGNTFASNSPALAFNTTYSFNLGGEEINIPAVQRNNTVSRVTAFKNYFAYDDGTAEAHLAMQNAQAAVRFTANTPDTLRAVQFHIPHVNQVDVSNKVFNIKVWLGELDDTPEYEAQLQRPYYADNYFDTLQGFTTYPLIDDITGELKPVALPVGDFYVGWQQLACSEDCIPMGLDKNKPAAIQQARWKVNGGSNWQTFTSQFSGAIMIRAIVGAETPWSTPTQTPAAITDIRCYPNPATDRLYFDVPMQHTEGFTVELYDMVGRLWQRQPLQPMLQLSQVPKGLNMILIKDAKGQRTQVHKIVFE